MSKNWQCPNCNAVNSKPDYVLRVERLQQSMGVVGFGTTSEPSPHCVQCDFEADINAMLRGDYDYEGEVLPDQESKEKKEPKSNVLAASTRSDRLALFVVGGVVALLCAGALIVGCVVLYMNRARGEEIVLSQPTVRPTSTMRVVVATATTPPTPTPTLTVKMLSKLESQKMVEEQEILFLARKADEQYSSDELDQMPLVTYTIHLDRSEPLAWGMGWCTTTEAILQQNFEHIHYTFTLAGKNIPIDQFVEVEYYSENMQGYCRQYYIVLTDWSSGEHLIETAILYDQPINDGWDDYPAASKTFEYHVILP